jgi:cell division protein FtsB/Fe-S cluster assembly iron-binding protein IscA
MVRMAIVGIVALVLGAVTGVGVVRGQMATIVTAARADEATAREELQKVKAEAQEAKARATHLEAEVDSLRTQLDMARESLNETLAEFMQAEPEPLMDMPAEAPAEEPLEAVEDPRPEERDRGNREGRERWRERRGDQAQADDGLTREQRRQEFAAQMRERANEMARNEMAKWNDPVAQQRISTINEQTQYMMDLRMQMREAQTDEEREALRTAMDQTRDTIRALTEEQQDYALRQLASQFGITAPGAQDQFIAGLRETQQSPYFRSWGMMGGPGGFGGFGRPGGGGRR